MFLCMYPNVIGSIYASSARVLKCTEKNCIIKVSYIHGTELKIFLG